MSFRHCYLLILCSCSFAVLEVCVTQRLNLLHPLLKLRRNGARGHTFVMLSRSVGSAAMTPASCMLMTCTFSPFFLGEPRSMFIHFIDLSKPPAFDFIDFLYGFPIFDFIDFSSRFYDFSFWLPRARVALLSPASRGGSFRCSFWIFVIFQDTRSAL